MTCKLDNINRHIKIFKFVALQNIFVLKIKTF